MILAISFLFAWAFILALFWKNWQFENLMWEPGCSNCERSHHGN
jgi:hypothetical protein